MNGLDIDRCAAPYCNAVTMRADCMDDIIAKTVLSEELRSLKAVLFRIELKIYIVQKSYDAPVFSLISISQFSS